MKGKQTYILRWNPEISSWGKDNYRRDYGNGFYDLAFRLPVGMNWSIYEWENLNEGDEFYFFLTGDDQTAALVGKGHFTSKPYKVENWRGGNGRRIIRYADFLMKSSFHPDDSDILHVADFRDQIPDYDFGHGHAGVLLEPEIANNLDSIYETFRQKQLAKIHCKPTYKPRKLAPCIQIEGMDYRFFPELEGEKLVEGFTVLGCNEDWVEFWVEETSLQAALAVDHSHAWDSFWTLSEKLLPRDKAYFEIHVEDYDPIHSSTPISISNVKEMLSPYRQILEEDGKVSLFLLTRRKTTI